MQDVLPGWSIGVYQAQGMATTWGRRHHLKGESMPSIEQLDDRPVFVFIEGDGRAWRSRTVRASNPTPSQPVAAQLANLTSAFGETVYLARPCQFFDEATLARMPQCTPAMWTDKRYSKEALRLLSATLDDLVDAEQRQLILIGYSGGGVIAALLAAQRTDVYGLITVAANLDLIAWTTHHNVAQLREALSPAAFGVELSSVPQFHLHGARDKTVPRAVHEAYLAELKNEARTKTVYLDEYDHSCCWSRSWIDHLQVALAYFDANH